MVIELLQLWVGGIKYIYFVNRQSIWSIKVPKYDFQSQLLMSGIIWICLKIISSNNNSFKKKYWCFDKFKFSNISFSKILPNLCQHCIKYAYLKKFNIFICVFWFLAKCLTILTHHWRNSSNKLKLCTLFLCTNVDMLWEA